MKDLSILYLQQDSKKRHAKKKVSSYDDFTLKHNYWKDVNELHRIRVQIRRHKMYLKHSPHNETYISLLKKYEEQERLNDFTGRVKKTEF